MINMSLSSAANAVNGVIAGEDVTFRGCSTDSRTLEDGNLFIAIRGEHFNGHTFLSSASDRGAAAAMVEEQSKEGMLPLLVTQDTFKAMGMLAEQWRSEFDIPLLAITGSNGKTTVKEMVSSILGLSAAVLSTRGNLNNHIGVPLTLFNLSSEHKYAVIEMGANHLGEIAWLSKIAKPTVALITQCAPAHLEGFGSEEGVARAKAEIFSGLDKNGIAVVNADDKYADFWKETASNYRQISFGLENTATIMASEITYDTDTGRTSFLMQFPNESISTSILLSGIHNVQNSIAAAACCLAIGVPALDIKEGLEKMQSVEGRMHMHKINGGSRLFDDTYNANPGSLKAGLEVLSSYQGNRILILGDMGELGGESVEHHKQAGEMARKYGVCQLYALGKLTRHTVDGFGIGATHFSNMDDLISVVKNDLANEATVLVKGSRVMKMEIIVKSLIGEG